MAIKFGNFTTTVNDKVATLVLEDKEAFFNNTDIPKEDLVKVFDYMEEYNVEATKAAAAAAGDVLVANKEVEVVNVEMPYTTSKRGRVNVSVEREHLFTNPKNREETYTAPYISSSVKIPQAKQARAKTKELEKTLVDLLNA